MTYPPTKTAHHSGKRIRMMLVRGIGVRSVKPGANRGARVYQMCGCEGHGSSGNASWMGDGPLDFLRTATCNYPRPAIIGVHSTRPGPKSSRWPATRMGARSEEHLRTIGSPMDGRRKNSG